MDDGPLRLALPGGMGVAAPSRVRSLGWGRGEEGIE